MNNLFSFSPDLTWRDIQHLIARSSQPLSPPILDNRWSRHWPSWGTNGAGLTGKFKFLFICFCLLSFFSLEAQTLLISIKTGTRNRLEVRQFEVKSCELLINLAGNICLNLKVCVVTTLISRMHVPFTVLLQTEMFWGKLSNWSLLWSRVITMVTIMPSELTIVNCLMAGLYDIHRLST